MHLRNEIDLALSSTKSETNYRNGVCCDTFAVAQHTTYRAKRISAHSITSSAMARIPDGISMSSARAVCRLMTSSNLVDCTTGRASCLRGCGRYIGRLEQTYLRRRCR